MLQENLYRYRYRYTGTVYTLHERIQKRTGATESKGRRKLLTTKDSKGSRRQNSSAEKEWHAIDDGRRTKKYEESKAASKSRRARQ